MKLLKLLIFFLLISFLPQLFASEEELSARRIVGFWKDKEFDLAKSQIENFFLKYPNSSFADSFHAILGEIAIKQMQFDSAIENYQKIQSLETQNEILNNYLLALYHLQKYQEVLDKSQLHLNDPINGDICRIYCAEAAMKLGKNNPALLAEAKNHFEQLSNSSYSLQALLALAEISKKEGDLSLFKKYLNKVISTSSPLPYQKNLIENALIQVFHTYATELNWEEILSLEDKLDLIESEENKLTVHYYFGLANAQKKRFSTAKKHLTLFLFSKCEHPFCKKALLLCLNCCLEENDFNLFDQIEKNLKNMSLQMEEMSYLFFLQGLKEKRVANNEKALDCLEQVLEKTSFLKNHFFLEKCYLETIQLLYEEGMWQHCVHYCQNFFELFPKSHYLKSIAHTFFNALVNTELSKTSDFQLLQQNQNQIQVLIGSALLDAEDLGLAKLIQAKNCVFLKEYKGAEELLIDFLENYKSHSQLLQAHYLLAICFFEESKLKEAIHHAEKALSLDEFPTKSTLLKLLFNAHKKLSESDYSDEKNTHLQKAADYLFALYEINEKDISYENQCWLSNLYYSNVESYFEKFNPLQIEGNAIENEVKKALLLFEGLIKKYPYQESTAYKLAMLYHWHSKEKLHLKLLSELVAYEKNHIQFQRFYNKSRLALAEAYQRNKQDDYAIEFFKELESENGFESKKAKLILARMQFAMLPSEQKTESSALMQDILKKLKDVQVSRQLAQEPIHLEAAIDYAFMKASLCNSEEKNKKLLSLLEKVKQDFTSLEDIVSKDYHELRAQNSSKDLIYQAYMRFIDAYILLLQAQIAHEDGLEEQAVMKKNASHALFTMLRQGKYALTPYLIEKAREGMEK